MDRVDQHRPTSGDEDDNNNERTKKKRRKKSKSRNHTNKINKSDCDVDDDHHATESSSHKKSKKEKKKKKGEKRKRKEIKTPDDHDDHDDMLEKSKKKKRRKKESNGSSSVDDKNDNVSNEQQAKSDYFPFEYQHILAPMVGASELAFRLLCRKYGATLSYTPMMSASQFVKEAKEKSIIPENNGHQLPPSSSSSPSNNKTIANSNICEFQTIPQDRPLVAHFSASDPTHFALAAKLVESHCDAVDLNLGCPQRTAYLGHYGSYLLGEDDRKLVLDIVRAAKEAVSIPIFVKIRLLDTVEDTMRLCRQLRDAGASLIAIHARYRASWERTGPGARDGPALLDQVSLIKQSMPDFPIISNGNVITYDDVVENKKATGANGIMSAEGILNNPALYLPRLGDVEKDGEREVPIPIFSPLRTGGGGGGGGGGGSADKKTAKAIRKLQKKLREIVAIENKVEESGEESINDDQRSKLKAKSEIQTQLNGLENASSQPSPIELPNPAPESQTRSVKLSELHKAGNNKLVLAREYLSLVRSYPTKIRSVVFHTRRMCKDLLEQYQLLEECIASTTIDEVEAVILKCERYVQHPEQFRYDQQKASREKEALAHRRREEGKRKTYEGRMMRKAKREGLADLEHYLRIGAEVPTVEIVRELKAAPKEERLARWKKYHSQHCMGYHLEDGGCKRDRTCAFLHVEAKDANKFVEDDEVAG